MPGQHPSILSVLKVGEPLQALLYRPDSSSGHGASLVGQADPLKTYNSGLLPFDLEEFLPL